MMGRWKGGANESVLGGFYYRKALKVPELKAILQKVRPSDIAWCGYS